MNSKTNQTGSAFLGVLLAVLVIGVAVFAGYKVYSTRNAADNSLTTTTSPSTHQASKASIVSGAPAVSTTSDLDKASQSLDANDPASSNTSDSTQLDAQTNGF